MALAIGNYNVKKPKTFHTLPNKYINKLPSIYETQKLYVKIISSSNPSMLTYYKSTFCDYSHIALLDLSDVDFTHLALLGIKVFPDENNIFKHVFFNGSHRIPIILNDRSLYGY